MTCFALAHMSCARAWAWGEVPDLLRAAGHRVVAPDLPLHAGVTPMEHAELLADAVGGGLEPLVVAGHSYGGLVAMPVAEMMSGRVLAVVLIDAVLCDDGESAHDARPHKAVARRAEADERADGMWTPGAPGPFDPDWAERLEPMPISAMETPIVLHGGIDKLPRTFVHCRRGGMDDQAARAAARGWRIVEVDASHGLPLEDPGRCAEVLLEVAAG